MTDTGKASTTSHVITKFQQCSIGLHASSFDWDGPAANDGCGVQGSGSRRGDSDNRIRHICSFRHYRPHHPPESSTQQIWHRWKRIVVDQLVSRHAVTDSSGWFSILATIRLQLRSATRIGPESDTLHRVCVPVCKCRLRTSREPTAIRW